MRRLELWTGEIEIPVFNQQAMAWVLKIFKGRVFEVEGERLELFKLRVLARSINYTETHIRRWETERKFPRPTFKLEYRNGQANRYYSKQQIANVRAMYCKYLNLFHAQGGRFATNDFLKDVRQVFYQRTMLPEAETGDVR